MNDVKTPIVQTKNVLKMKKLLNQVIELAFNKCTSEELDTMYDGDDTDQFCCPCPTCNDGKIPTIQEVTDYQMSSLKGRLAFYLCCQVERSRSNIENWTKIEKRHKELATELDEQLRKDFPVAKTKKRVKRVKAS